MKGLKMLDFVKIADSTRECQRNWNNEKVKDEDIETIVQSAINMPSRKQMIDFELFVVTNPETINHAWGPALQLSSSSAEILELPAFTWGF